MRRGSVGRAWYETRRLHRVHLRGHPNILKRLLVHVCGFNLWLLTAHAGANGRCVSFGTPRSLQGRAVAIFGPLIGLLDRVWRRLLHSWASEPADRPDSSCDGPATHCHEHMTIALRMGAFTTGC